MTPHNWWPYEEVGHTQEATKEVSDLLGCVAFDYPKPLRFLRRILQIASDKDSIILDFFSGSATTAHAVMQLNAEDGGNRRFIVKRKPPAVPVVLKSFSYAQKKYPSEARNYNKSDRRKSRKF